MSVRPAQRRGKEHRSLLPVEDRQREALQKRLAGRKRRPSREVFEDFGVPTLNDYQDWVNGIRNES